MFMDIMGEVRSSLGGDKNRLIFIFHELEKRPFRERGRVIAYIISWARSNGYEVALRRDGRGWMYKNCWPNAAIFAGAYHNSLRFFLRNPKAPAMNGFVFGRLLHWHERFTKIAISMTIKWFDLKPDQGQIEAHNWEALRTYAGGAVTNRSWEHCQVILDRLSLLVLHKQYMTKDGPKIVRKKAFPKKWLKLFTALVTDYESFAKEFQKEFFADMEAEFFA